MKAYRLILLSIVFVTFPATGRPESDLWSAMFARQLEAARAGDADAGYEVGIMYLKGQGVEADRDEARRWLEQAERQGNERAASKLRRMQNNDGEFAAIIKAAEGGDTGAQYEAAMSYLKGKGTNIDTERGLLWLKRSAAAGNDTAATRLGIIYYKGDFGTAEPDKAFELLKRTARNDTLAQFYLGEMYTSGEGVAQDFDKAEHWYRKAAEGGFQWANGKLINLEEERRMQARRTARLQQDGNRTPAPAPATAAAKPANKAGRTPAAAAKPVAVRRAPLERLLDHDWVRDTRPVEFLPSSDNECEPEQRQLVCYSAVLDQVREHKTIKYRVKSVIEAGTGQSFTVRYKNLVLDVVATGSQQSDAANEGLGGYDDQEEQGFHVRTGWTREHSAACSMTGSKAIECVKDGTHRMAIAAH
jgi:TPR repeat protein